MAQAEVFEDASVLFTELNAKQYKRGLDWLNSEANTPGVSWEHAEHEPDWIRLVNPTDEQLRKFTELVIR